jgi:hypothetical protein
MIQKASLSSSGCLALNGEREIKWNYRSLSLILKFYRDVCLRGLRKTSVRKSGVQIRVLYCETSEYDRGVRGMGVKLGLIKIKQGKPVPVLNSLSTTP